MSERMQSLLSRAVDDQRSEQRSITDALDEVRAQLATLSQQVAAGREQPVDDDQASAVTALTVELRESTRRTADRLDTVARMVAQRGEDLVALQATVSALSEHANGIATYLGDRARDDSSRLMALEQRLVTLQNDMTAVGSHVSGLTEAAATATGDGLDARIRSIVAGALVGTERRLAAHIEDAVLALAEAMLRRRPAGSQPEVAQPEVAQPEVAQPEVAQPEVAQPEVAQPETVQPTAGQPFPPQPPVEQVQPAAPVTQPAPVAAPLADPSPVAGEPPVAELPTAEVAPPNQTVDLTDGHIAASGAADGGPADDGSATDHGSNGLNPKVPAAWTTVMPDDDDQRRRGWFRSRE
jgi:hypothetical protein